VIWYLYLQMLVDMGLSRLVDFLPCDK